MKQEIQVLDVVALTMDLPKHNLFRGEIGAVVECYPNDGYEVEFISLDGYRPFLKNKYPLNLPGRGQKYSCHTRSV